MHEEWGLTGPPPSISMLDALTKAAFNPFVDLQDLVAPKALDMEAEHDVDVAAAAAAALPPADETFGQGFDPGEFGGAPPAGPPADYAGGFGGVDQGNYGGGYAGGFGGVDQGDYGGGYGDPGDGDL